MSEYPIADALIGLALLCVVSLTALTIVATDRSRERTQCYRTSASIEACPKPEWWEDVLKNLLSSKTATKP